MSATAHPWAAWQGWVAAHADAADRNSRRRVRLSLHDLSDLRDLKVDWSRLPRPEITFYTPNQIRHLIRFDNSLGQALPTSGWLPAQRDPVSQWRFADLAHYQLPPAASPAPAPAPHSTHAWLEGAARGLPLGAVALVLLVLIARAADKCWDGSLFRRRRSSQRPAADGTATTNTDTSALPELPPPCELHPGGPPAPPVPPAPPAADPPPPYSECARSVTLPRKAEDPPPPYNSACYVSYSSPQTGMPTVHFYNNLFGAATRNNRPRRSANRDLHIYGFNLDTGHGPNSDSSTNSEVVGRGLVFDNGRVVERGAIGTRQIVYDQNSNSDGSDDSNGNNGNRKPICSSRGVFVA